MELVKAIRDDLVDHLGQVGRSIDDLASWLKKKKFATWGSF